MTAASPPLTNPSSVTPILDREIPVPLPAHRDGKARPAGIFMGAMVGVGLGLVMVLADRSVLPGLVTPFSRAFISLTPLGFLAVLVFCLYLCISVLETGHLYFRLPSGL